MKAQLAALLSLLVLGLPAIVNAGQNSFSVEGLRCEYLENPLGIDVEKPRLSWQLSPGPRGQRQTAYHILVASSPEKLRNDQGDLWDSGRVDSDQSVFVVYAGRPLTSGERLLLQRINQHRARQPDDPATAGHTQAEDEPNSQDLQRRLYDAGLLSEIKPPITDLTPYRDRQAVPIQGESLSATVIGERR